MKTVSAPTYEFGCFHLNTREPAKRGLLSKGEVLDLGRERFAILSTLVKKHGQVVTKEELIQSAWGTSVEWTEKEKKQRKAAINRLQKQISLLKDKLERECPGAREYIETKAGGYSFVARVVEAARIPDEALADLYFDEWARSAPSGKRIRFALGAGVAAAILLWVCLLAAGESEWLMVAASGIHFAVIVVAFFAGFSVFSPSQKEFLNPRLESSVRKSLGYINEKEWDEAKLEGRTALRVHTTYWLWGLFLSWGLLYLILLVRALVQLDPVRVFLQLEPETGVTSLSIAATLFNNCSTAAILLCYGVLSKPTLVSHTRIWLNWNLLRWVVAIVAFFAGELVLIRGNLSAALELADSVSGVAGAIAMALYFARLQSQLLLGNSPWLLFVLFSYTAIQPLYAAVHRDPIAASVIIEAALILKCLLYLLVAWLYKGRLLFYFLLVRPINERVNLQWKEFIPLLYKEQASRPEDITASAGTVSI